MLDSNGPKDQIISKAMQAALSAHWVWIANIIIYLIEMIFLNSILRFLKLNKFVI